MPGQDDTKQRSIRKVHDSFFRRVGKELPQTVDYERDIIASLPRTLLASNNLRAFGQLATTLVYMTMAYFLLYRLPWFLLPIGWALAGFAATGLFAIGRDCFICAWSPSRVVNWLVGAFVSAPLFLQRNAGGISLSALFVAGLVALLGVSATIKYWLLPLIFATLVLRFCMSCQYLVPTSAWNVHVRACRTMYVKMPSLFSSLVQNVNVYIPTEFSIPSYNLMDAYQFLAEKWSPYMNELSVSARLVKVMVSSKFSKTTSAEPASATSAPAASVKASEVEMHHEKSLLQKINWLHVIILFVTPAAAVYGVLTTPLLLKTALWAFAYYFLTGIAITGGYHRLWAHRAYKASWIVQMTYAFFGAGAVQGSALWWCRNHRVHHRYTDTNKDPYNAARGFFYAHFGWMLVYPDPKNYARVEMMDLKQNSVLKFQHYWYIPMVVGMGVLFPAAVAHYALGDFWGGLYYAGLLRLVVVHHTTFCVNSVAHFFGDHTFDDERTPKDHFITALMTLGEGYHNFHHEFPNDFRNGIRWFDYDPTKWTIRGLSALGLTWDLKEFPANEIVKGKLNMKQKKLDQMKKTIKWPKSPEELPEMSWDKVAERVARGEQLVIVDGLVHDVGDFVEEHPGGSRLLAAGIGRDVSKSFHGLVYGHSNAARNLLSNFRIARIVGDKSAVHELVVDE